MFSTEFNGYKKQEVDNYIASLKAEHEKALMEERLKVLEAEKKILDFKKKSDDVINREKNIMTALESFKKFQAEGSRNIEVLRVEQLRMVYLQLQEFLYDLNEKYPGILINNSYKKLISDIENILEKTEAKRNEIISTGTENDPMRILLNKMQEKKVQESPREIRIERVDRVYDRPSQIKPVTSMKLEENDNYDTLVEKFLNTQPEEQPRSMKIQSNGFDLKEAVNPKDDLNEIMKAFDFYSDDNKANPNDYDF